MEKADVLGKHCSSRGARKNSKLVARTLDHNRENATQRPDKPKQKREKAKERKKGYLVLTNQLCFSRRRSTKLKIP